MAEEIKVPAGIYDMVTRCMEQEFPDNVAIRYVAADGKTVVEKKYREYAQDIRRMTAYLKAEVPGIKGQRVVLLSRNSYEYCVASFGIILAGGVLVTLNQKKTWEELEYELGLVEPALILNDGIDYGCRAELEAAYGPKLRPMDCYRNTAPGELTNCIGHDDLMMLMFTSGTTGRSKGVMLSERNMCASLCTYGARAENWITSRLPEGQKLPLSHMTLLPMFHLGAFGCLFTWAWMGWAQNLGSLRSFYKDLKRMPSQAMAAVPVLVQSIHHDLMTGKQDKLGDLWALNCMSAMFDPQTLMDLHDHGMVISQLYGSTETTGGGLINFAEDAKHIGSIGKDDGHCEIKLDNGELCMRGGDVMLGYYKDPEGTAEVVDAEGWFHTGDLARVDEDGYYFLTGRKKNVIILDSGENVSPEELEGLLEKCPAVKECLVKEKGKKICAVVCCEEADQQTVRDFITETNRTLPLYKHMVVEFSAQPLPRNAAGKLLRS